MKPSKGFTIIELIISIFILSLAVVGIFSAFSMMVILTADAADKLTATYLAQEGMEIVRNVRDTNWLNMDLCDSGKTIPANVSCPSSWVDGLTTTENGADNSPVDCSCPVGDDCTSKGCNADYTTGTNIATGATQMANWASSDGDYLNIDAATGFYDYKAGTRTKFKRKILITPVADANGTENYILNVEIQTSWDQKATILNSAHRAGDCSPSNCVKLDAIMYDWYNYSQNAAATGGAAGE
jgi:type II secretory pathway pseudopilin PulG